MTLVQLVDTAANDFICLARHHLSPPHALLSHLLQHSAMTHSWHFLADQLSQVDHAQIDKIFMLIVDEFDFERFEGFLER